MSYNVLDLVDFKSGIRDAFGRVRISSPQTIFEHSNVYSSLSAHCTCNDFDALTAVNGKIFHNPNEACMDLTVTTASGDRCVRQTYRYFTYQPGKSKLVFLTGVLDISGTDVNRCSKIGVFDDGRDKTVDSGGDGFFFALSAGELAVVKRSTSSGTQTDTIVPQSAWNIDKMDGTGNSTISIDTTKTQIFFFDQEWLGVGTVRMGFVVDGALYYCHQFHHANIENKVYTRRASLPIRYEVENLNTCSTGGILKEICNTVISEGGFSPIGRLRSINNDITTVTVGTSSTAVLGIRLQPGFNRGTITVRNINVSVGTNDNLLLSLVFNPTIYSSNNWVQIPASFVEYNVTDQYVSGGHVITSAYVNANSRSINLADVTNTAWIASNIQGTPLPFVIVAKNFLATADIYTSITWQELQ